ncbi:MAG: hypothetical protein ABSG75_09170 [Syntrophales bacterium]|jgi:hypothetical protein
MLGIQHPIGTFLAIHWIIPLSKNAPGRHINFSKYTFKISKEMSPRMKHLTVVSVAGAIAILLISIFAVKISSTVPAKVDSSKASVIRTAKRTRVTFIGVVKGLSDTTILVERAVKGKVELIEFVLDKPTEKIEVGDKVKVSFIKKEGKYIAANVTLVVNKKIIKKDTPKTK